MKVVFPVPQVGGRRDSICETITLSQSKEAAFRWSVGALGGANNHSSPSHCVTEVLNPSLCSAHHLLLNRPLGVTLQALRRPRFERGAGARGDGSSQSGSQHLRSTFFSLF